MTFDYLDTQRLRLRKITDEDYLTILTQCSDDELMHLLGITSDTDIALERQKAKKGFATHNKSYLMFHVLEKDTMNNIGWCGFHTWYLDHRRAEIGYALRDEYKAKGIMTEVMSAVLRYGFEEMNLHRIEAFIGPQNMPSIKLAEKFGFTKEGQMREHFCRDGVFEDSVVYALLSEEWGRNPSFNDILVGRELTS